MPPAETGVTVLAKAVLAIADDPFPFDLRGPGVSMIEALAAKKGGATKMAVANRWLFTPLLKRQLADSPSTAAAFHTTNAPTMLEGSRQEHVMPQSANAHINYSIAPWHSSRGGMARAKAAEGDAKADPTGGWE